MNKPTAKHLNEQDPVAELCADSSRCVKCGRCLSVCPVYRETGREPEAARGKLALIESIASGAIQAPTKKLQDIISFCLLCGACAESCPNLVPADAIIQKAREAIISASNPAKPTRFALRHILPFPKRMDNVHKIGKMLRPLLLKNVPSESGLYFRFPLGGDQQARLIPPFADEPFLKKHSQEKNWGKSSCTLFIGCVSNYVFPEIPEAVLGIFKHLDVSASIPPGQACCGLMAFGTGAAEVDRTVAQKNIEAFESAGSNPIVAFCSSCSSHLKDYGTLFEDEPWRSRALRFSQRVMDFSEFLVQAGFESRLGDKGSHPSSRLTFHDPCHLRRKQGISEQPRQLLKCVEGIEFIETGDEHLCCGSGGSFNLTHYPESQNIFKRRLKPVEEAAVDTVVTTCMGCLLQFLDGIHQEGKPTRCKHLAQILSEALEGS